MNPRRGFGILGVLATLAFAGIVAVFAYNAGVSAGLTTGSNTATTVVVAGGGFGFFWILPILFLFFVFAAIAGAGRHARHGWGGHGYRHGNGRSFGPGGPGGPNGGPDRLPPFVEPMLADWHRRAHADPGTTEGASSMPSASAAGPGATPDASGPGTTTP